MSSQRGRASRFKPAVSRLLHLYPPLFRLSSRLYHQVLRRGFRSLSAGAPDAIEHALRAAHDRLGSEAGDYYEFGLFRGYTFLHALAVCRKLDLDQTRLWGFDSFAGLPAVDGPDGADGQFFEGQFACSKEQVEKMLTNRGMDWNRARLIEGFYDEVLTEELQTSRPFGPVAVALFDCDLYSSTLQALRWLAPLLRSGSSLLFDDWFAYGGEVTEGQPRALEEFLDGQPELRMEPWFEFPRHGKAFILT